MLYATFLLYKFPEQKLYEKFPVMQLMYIALRAVYADFTLSVLLHSSQHVLCTKTYICYNPIVKSKIHCKQALQLQGLQDSKQHSCNLYS